MQIRTKKIETPATVVTSATFEKKHSLFKRCGLKTSREQTDASTVREYHFAGRTARKPYIIRLGGGPQCPTTSFLR